MKQELQYLPSEIICGLHSNIPLCCVMWYLNGWDSIECENLEDWIIEPNYVACPDCVARMIEGRQKPNVLKECNCNV